MLFRKKEKIKINPIVERRKKTARKSGRTGRIFYRLVILAFLGVTVYALFFSGFLAITDISVGGAEKTDPREIEDILRSRFSGKYLTILPKNNIILASRTGIASFLTEEFKLIEEAEIEKDFPGYLTVSISEKKPLLILRSGGKEYVINDKGVAYEEADFASSFLEENVLPVLEDSGGKEISVKSETLEPGYMDFILAVRKGMAEDLGIRLAQTVKTSSIVSGDIEVETEEGWKARYNMGVGAEKGIEMLKAVLGGKVTKDNRKDLEYVDLRTDNKVYLKFKQIANDELIENR